MANVYYTVGQYAYSNANNLADASWLGSVLPLTAGTLLTTESESSIESSVSGSITKFLDPCFTLTDKALFSSESSYYIRFYIQKQLVKQRFFIKLYSSLDDSTTDPTSLHNTDPIHTAFATESTGEQFIGSFIVPKVSSTSESNEWAQFELIFTPFSQALDSILFKKYHTDEETYLGDNNFAQSNLTTGVVLAELRTVGDIGLPSPLLKIGVQGEPGLLMCINGEEIRVGRSGIYELKSDLVQIKSFGIVGISKGSASSEITTSIYKQADAFVTLSNGRYNSYLHTGSSYSHRPVYLAKEDRANKQCKPFIVDYVKINTK